MFDLRPSSGGKKGDFSILDLGEEPYYVKVSKGSWKLRVRAGSMINLG